MSSPTDHAMLFRERLALALSRAEVSQSALARAAGVDRSSISALLKPGTRLPNAPLVASCARALSVSSDWLLGLTDQPEPIAAALAKAFTLTSAPRALFDETTFAWHQAAAGFKIRHIPATLPDIFKNRDVVEWEYRDHLGPTLATAIASFESQLNWLKTARSDYEIALPLHELDSFAKGTGYWTGLSPDTRHDQLMALHQLCETHYPTLRIYLFDAHLVYSAPITVFGPSRAVVYLGRDYISFQDPATVLRISQHFDWIIRSSTTSARLVAQTLSELADGVQ